MRLPLLLLLRCVDDQFYENAFWTQASVEYGGSEINEVDLQFYRFYSKQRSNSNRLLHRCQWNKVSP